MLSANIHFTHVQPPGRMQHRLTLSPCRTTSLFWRGPCMDLGHGRRNRHGRGVAVVSKAACCLNWYRCRGLGTGGDVRLSIFYYTLVILAVETDYHYVALNKVGLYHWLLNRFSVVADYRQYFLPVGFSTEACISLAQHWYVLREVHLSVNSTHGYTYVRTYMYTAH